MLLLRLPAILLSASHTAHDSPGGSALASDLIWREVERVRAVKPVVVSMGAWSSQLLRPLGIAANIYPMRGYSVTLPAIGTSNMTSITDPGSKTVFSRLGDQVRIAGFADFIGYRTDKDEERARKLLGTARRTAPKIADFDAEHAAEEKHRNQYDMPDQRKIGRASCRERV